MAKLEEVTRSLKEERGRSKQLEQQLEAVNDELVYRAALILIDLVPDSRRARLPTKSPRKRQKR